MWTVCRVSSRSSWYTSNEGSVCPELRSAIGSVPQLPPATMFSFIKIIVNDDSKTVVSENLMKKMKDLTKNNVSYFCLSIGYLHCTYSSRQAYILPHASCIRANINPVSFPVLPCARGCTIFLLLNIDCNSILKTHLNEWQNIRQFSVCSQFSVLFK